MKTWAAAFALVVLTASPALAQSVVVPDVSGDARGRVRAQLERELRKEEGLTVVPRARFERATAKRGFKAGRARTPEAVAAVARGLGVDAALLGRVRGTELELRAVDAAGEQLLVRRLPLRRGRVSGEDVARLVGALGVALSPPPSTPAQTVPASATVPARTPAVSPVAEASFAVARAPARPAKAEGPETPVVQAPQAPKPTEAPPAPTPRARIGPRTLTFVLAGTSTWRSYCAAPGVASCAESTAPAQTSQERSIEFSTSVPYTGGTAQLELFPLALLGDSPLKGLGLLAEFGFGASAVTITYQTDGGEVNGGVTLGADRRLSVMGTWRQYFAFRGPQATLPGFVGARAGYLSRHFLVAREARAQLPSSKRGPLAAGLDVSLPLARLLRLEASGMYLLLPQPDVETLQRYGERVRSRGFALELGIAGDISGPLGYQLRFRMLSFHDRYSGAGDEWLTGGVADEVYSGLNWGLTLAF
ncbi:MAG: hypothetical protein L0Y64_12850 [Myxococcaceae bacterium]|nr:hypothetical protein [Myxococcaceae bacterium]